MEEDLSESDAESVDSVTITEVLEMCLEDDRLGYLCRTDENCEEVYDRSDLMDGASNQKLVMRFERKHPPPWDVVCFYCDGEGCEECECPDCDRTCRMIRGVNYGCPCHPVV